MSIESSPTPTLSPDSPPPATTKQLLDQRPRKETPVQAKPAHSSSESLDLVMDVDLERRVNGDGEKGPASTDLEQGKREGATSPPTALAEDDPENPRNWKTGKKVYTCLVLCIWVLTLTYASTAYVGSLPALMARFHMSQELAIAGVTFTVLGFAAGPLVWGPGSEIWGRRKVYIVTGVAYIAFSFGAAFANNAGALLAFRFLVGFFGSSSINNVPASVGDFTHPATRGPYTVPYALMAFGGPALGPLCSSFIQSDVGFRWNLRVMAIFSTVLTLLVMAIPETHGPTILKQKLKREGLSPPAPSRQEVIAVFKTSMARPMLYLFTEPVVMFVSLYLAVLYGILYGFFEAFTVVYLEIRGFRSTSYGLTYISLGLGFLISCILLATVANKAYVRAAAKAAAEGKRTPAEARLILAYPGAILAPISLFIFAWTAPFPHIHWIVPCLAEMLFGMSMLAVFTSFIPYLIESYLASAASALASGMASRALVGSVFPLFALQMYHKLTVQGATSLLAGLCLLLAPLPYVFGRYGHKIRARSKAAAFRNIRKEPALAPLVLAVGLGVVGSLGFAFHYLSSNPDVVIKKSRTEPWNNVQQGQNSKLFSFNKDFWETRKNLPDPRAAFMDGSKPLSSAAAVAKAQAIRKSREADGKAGAA